MLRFLEICTCELHGKYKEPDVYQSLLTNPFLWRDGMSLNMMIYGGREVAKDTCDPFSMESQSDSPSAEHGDLSAYLPRSRLASQGLEAKPGKDKSVKDLEEKVVAGASNIQPHFTQRQGLPSEFTDKLAAHGPQLIRIPPGCWKTRGSHQHFSLQTREQRDH
ncbi:Protein Dennd6A [Manis pentadactyla]|nr:Protein Dennd6A [Manis pentadactyla]